MDNQEPHKRYDELAQKLIDGTITPAEKEEYLEWLHLDDGQPLNIPGYFAGSKQELEDRMLARLKAAVADRALSPVIGLADQPVRSVNYRRWLPYAAAAVLILTIGVLTYLRTSSPKHEQPLANNSKLSGTDVAPGGNKATLTLSDGTTIPLDGAANGAIAKQGNSSIVKLANGKIIYNLKGIAETEERMNTMATPRGGQYQLTLQDGTKVWLNAASSITYPAVFVDKERRVKVSGEAYFEVARNKTKPFIVSIDGKYAVEVLGTSFNINSYADEEKIKTTLLEGSIKVVSGKAANRNSVILKPGQQAIMANVEISVRSDINTEEVMAWKEGYFHFSESSLTAVLKQLARWYDVDVVYGEHVPSKTFIGEIPRDATLSQVLRVLEKTGVHFHIEGKKIIVMP